MIRFDNVSKHFGSGAALSDVNLVIDKGQFVFLIGPSGAGKTTLLRLVIRDLLPTTGKILFDQKDVGHIPAGKIHLLRRSVGMVFQDFKLLADRTVSENIAIGLEIFQKQEKDMHRRVEEVLELVGLPDKSKHFPAQLSAGENQRVAIARAIVAGPKVLMADEPTGNLDPVTSWGIMEVLGAINKLGTTVVMATHKASIVDHMKKRTLVSDKGKLVRDDEKGSYRSSGKGKKG